MENVVFDKLPPCKMHFSQMLRRFFVRSGYIIFIISPLSPPSLFLTSSLSLLLFSFLSVVFRRLCCGHFSFVLCCRCSLLLLGGVPSREILPRELPRTRAEQSKLGGRGHGRPAREADLDPDVCINEHSQQTRHHGGHRDGERHRFPTVLHRRGRAHNTKCNSRMLDDVCLPRHGTDTSSWRWKEREIQLLAWPPCWSDLSPLDFTSGKCGKRRWESASPSPNVSCAP